MAAEKSFENKVKKFLESEGIYPLGTEKQKMTITPCGYWEKRWGGGKYVKAGMPDMHIVVNGISIEAEVKADNGTPSKLQKQKLKQIDEAECIGFVLYPDDFENFKRLILYIKAWSMDITKVVAKCGLENGWKGVI
jgi:hypothetical protein